jgi:hypothetical protein
VPVSREQKIYRKGDLPMAKNMKFEGKTTGELEQIMKESQHQLEVEQHRLNRLEQQMKEAEKTVRTHRLIIKGAELEAVFPDTKDMTKEDVKGLLNELASYGFVRELVEQTAMDSRQRKADDRREEGS